MTGADGSTIDKIEVAYARFNAAKTFTTAAPSRFNHVRLGALDATRDPARPDPYYNRVLGLDDHSWDDLDRALEWIEAAADSQATTRIDINRNHRRQRELERLEFRHVESLLWLGLDNLTVDRDRIDAPVRELTPTDWPAMRQLLEVQGPIDDVIWQAKRKHLCTETFRWFGLFDRDLLVAAASLWVHGSTGVLGSAFTRPDYRGRGHQGALIATRRRVGPDNLLVDVEPDSISHRNCVRAGFRDLEIRNVWTRAAPR